MPLEREDAITDAINAIRDGQVYSVRAAAHAYGVPWVTLQDRLHRATDHSMASETTQKLTSEQEKCLVEWIKELEAQGKAPSHTMVREMACKIIDSETLGKHWVERFLKRHPEITSCIGVPLESSRASNSTHNIVAEHFRRVRTLIRSHNILSDDMEYGRDWDRYGTLFQWLCDFWQGQMSGIR